MKKLFAILTAIIAVLMVSAMAEAKLEVTDFTQFRLDKGEGKYVNFTYAAITNTGDSACRVQTVYVQHTDGNGNVFLEKKCSNVYPSMLQPGETGYMFNSESFKEIEDPSVISQVVLTPEASESGVSQTYTLDCDVNLNITERDSDYSVLIDEIVTNNMDELRVSPYVCFRIYDQNDELIYVTGIYYGNVIAMPGSPVGFRVGGIWETSKCWKLEGRVPTKVVPYVYTQK